MIMDISLKCSKSTTNTRKMKNIRIKISFLMVTILLLACNNEPSMQRYFVDSMENPAFQNLSFSPQSFIKNAEELSQEDKAQLENITKLNFLMLQKNGNDQLYTSELAKVSNILKQEQYKNLFSAGEPSKQMQMFYVGEEEEIKEFIIFGKDKEMGFILARILGKNLSPNNIYRIMKMGNKLDLKELQKSLEQFTNQEV